METTPVRMNVRFSWGRLLGLLVLSSLGIAAIQCGYYASQPFKARQILGPVQVLAGPDEAWVFVERGLRIFNPDPWSDPNNWGVVDQQYAVVLNSHGEKNRIVVPRRGVSFNVNLSRILRHGDDFYLVQDQSQGTPRSVYRWSNDHFEPLESDESKSWLIKLGLNGKSSAELPAAIDAVTFADGWTHFGDNRPLYGQHFAWNGRTLRFETEQASPTTLGLQSSGADGPPAIDLLTIDSTVKPISREELQKLD